MYGGCGYGYYGYGYYGHGPPAGYGDRDLDGVDDFTHLIDAGVSLGLLDLDSLQGKYEVYGMPGHGRPGGEAEMTRRALRSATEAERWDKRLIEKEILLEEYDRDYSEWEELPEVIFPEWGMDTVWYGRYRGAAAGQYTGCIGYYGYGYAGGYYGCGQGPYGGFDALLDDEEDAEDLLLEVAEQLRDAVKDAAQSVLKANEETGFLSAYSTQPEDYV